MTGVTLFFVGLGAAVGSIMRYRVGRFVMQRVGASEFPWGTFVVNVIGTLLLGVFYQELDVHHSAPDWWVLLGTGFCGAFTTFSTMSVEALQLVQTRPVRGVVYIVGSFSSGLLLSWMAQWV
ncbi:fluoride efflux transporter CrcB [Alicyclobacillus ferrooxydans]|uniref:Fluoride-specific ion channel FluC n=1 Tax=Alicyclobacillus ferrooxydans TaxID=471514 RepID=A0A0P9ENI1_9BACL|nr:fluoride efflux transporter CrcB [Alicyclobacillus ferrooxydans]KPV44996.1 hypothetical protein AN477_04295 [Alicyclobacillus ferrooxydans]